LAFARACSTNPSLAQWFSHFESGSVTVSRLAAKWLSHRTAEGRVEQRLE
jgi:hypothetical protein